MTPKYQIFISSTYRDLIEEREQVIKTILRLNHIPIGMEAFNAANETQWAMIKRRIEESDYYIVIIAQRYGTIEEESGLSYTEKEYDYANEIGVPTYAFVLERSASWPGDKRETDPTYIEGLAKFIEKVERKMRVGWTNKDNLAAAVATTLSEQTTAFPRTGWVRADQVANPDTINEITRLSRENADLRQRLATLQQNATPLPELHIDLQVKRGYYEWFMVEDIGRSGITNTKMEPRVGSFIAIDVSNRGAMATDLVLEVTCNSPILTPSDIQHFQKRSSGYRYSEEPHSDGWKEAHYSQHSDGYREWKFKGNAYVMKSGQKHEFIIPLGDGAPRKELNGVEVQVDIFPVSGRHIQEKFQLHNVVEPDS